MCLIVPGLHVYTSIRLHTQYRERIYKETSAVYIPAQAHIHTLQIYIELLYIQPEIKCRCCGGVYTASHRETVFATPGSWHLWHIMVWGEEKVRILLSGATGNLNASARRTLQVIIYSER